MPMSQFPQLTLRITPLQEEVYSVQALYQQPGSTESIDAGVTSDSSFKIETQALSGSIPGEEYGRRLSEMFFQSESLRAAIEQSRRMAQSANLPLRLRLEISPAARLLQSLYWETLIDPASNAPFFLDENIQFSRLVRSRDFRSRRLPTRDNFSALVVIASPGNLEEYDLPPLDVQDELGRILDALSGIKVEGLIDQISAIDASKGLESQILTMSSFEGEANITTGVVTLDALSQQLRQQSPDLLYLMAHARQVDGEPALLLSQEGGRGRVVKGMELVSRLRNLEQPPIITVLAASQSAPLALQLVESGVPAALGIQSNITLDTLANFMPVFLGGLIKNGRVDQAAAAGRAVVRSQPDWWSPTVFTSLEDGIILADGEEMAAFTSSASSSANIQTNQSETPPSPYVYTKQIVHLRAEPRPFSSSLALLKGGAFLPISETDGQAALEKLGKPSEWIQVQASENQQGFIEANMLSLDPPRLPQAWIVVANPAQYDWESNFQAIASGSTPVTVDWTRARGSLAQRHIADSQPGDMVLAYTSSAQKRAIIGVGQVTAPPFTREGNQAVTIELLQRFSGEVTWETLREKLPALEKVRNQRASFSSVASGVWPDLRQLLIQADAGLNDLLPSEIADPSSPVELLLTPTGFPTSLAVGGEFKGSLRARNSGQTSVSASQFYNPKLAAEWYPIGVDPDDEPAFVDEKPWTFDQPLLPNATQTWTDIIFSSPQQTDSYEVVFTLRDAAGKLDAESTVWTVAVLEVSADIKRRINNLRQSLRRAKPSPPEYVQTQVGETLQQTRQALNTQDLETAENNISRAENEWKSWRQESGARQDLDRRLQNLGQRAADELPEDLQSPYRAQVDSWRKAIAGLEPLSNIEENAKNLGQLLDDLKTASASITAASAELDQANKPRSAQALTENYTNQLRKLVTRPYTHASFEKLLAELQNDLEQAHQEEPEAAEAEPEPIAGPQDTSAGEGTPRPTPMVQIYQRPEFALYTPPQPPDFEQRLTIEIGDEEIRLNYRGEDFRSPSTRLKDDVELRNPFNFTPLQYGKRLFDAIIRQEKMDGEGSTNDGYILARPDKRQQAFEIKISPKSEFAGYIWEYLSNDGLTPLAVYEASPFYRLYGSTPTPEEVEKWRIKKRPLKILFAICSPGELRPLSVPGLPGTPSLGTPPTSTQTDIGQIIGELPALDRTLESNIIHSAMDKLVSAGLAEYSLLGGPDDTEAVSWPRISQAVLDQGAHVLHILAHGVINPRKRASPFALVMETGKDRQYDLVYNKAFTKNWVKNSQLRLVVAAACNSGSPELRQNLQDDLASHLLMSGIPAVIAMQARIDEHTAQILTRRFYDDLARLGHIEMALAAARTAIYQDDPQNRAWGFPLLIMRQGVGELLETDPEALRRLSRPSDAEIRQDVKPRQSLTDRAVPTEALAEQALQGMLRSLGVYAQPSIVRFAGDSFANQLSGRVPAGLPLAEKQDLAALADLLAPAVNLRSWELQEYIEEYTGLELPESAYAQITAGLNAGKHIILIGAHGTAKTTLARAVCQFASGWRLRKGKGAAAAAGEAALELSGERYANDYVLSTATADWTTFDTIGGYMPDENQNLQFHPGLFLEAIRQGQWLIVDEINRAEIDKAIGPLFTVLSGQEVSLPYKVSSKDARIMPANELTPGERYNRRNWIPEGAGQESFDYVIHPNWRIIGTMNIYDKSSLFQLSFAFMRRFAFVDVDPPSDTEYLKLIERWIDEFIRQPALEAQTQSLGQADADFKSLVNNLVHLIWIEKNPAQTTRQQSTPDQNPIMIRRTIGPAIIRDMLSYIGQRYMDNLSRPPQSISPPIAPEEGDDSEDQMTEVEGIEAESGENPVQAAAKIQAERLAGFFGEAFTVYIVPQLDGLDYEGIREIYWHINDVLFANNPLKGDILNRIRVLYPHIRNWERPSEEIGV